MTLPIEFDTTAVRQRIARGVQLLGATLAALVPVALASSNTLEGVRTVQPGTSPRSKAAQVKSFAIRLPAPGWDVVRRGHRDSTIADDTIVVQVPVSLVRSGDHLAVDVVGAEAHLEAVRSARPRAPSLETGARDSLLGHLIGSWVLRGHMGGKDVVHDVTCRWVLGGEYVEMHEVSRDRTSAKTPAYEAIVYLVHDPHSHEYGA